MKLVEQTEIMKNALIYNSYCIIIILSCIILLLEIHVKRTQLSYNLQI